MPPAKPAPDAAPAPDPQVGEAVVNLLAATFAGSAAAEPPAVAPVSAVKVTRACRVNFRGVLIELDKDQVIDNHPELVRFLSETGAPVFPVE